MLRFFVVLAHLVWLIPLGICVVKSLFPYKGEWEEKKKKVADASWVIATFVAVLGIFSLRIFLYILDIYIESLWFDNLGFSQIFWKVSILRWILFWAILLAIIAVFLVNLKIVWKFIPSFKRETKQNPLVWNSGRGYSDRSRNEDEKSSWQGYGVASAFLVFVASLIIGLIMAAIVSGQWEKILLWSNRVSVGTNDPIFGKDIGFYLFSLPFLNALSSWIFWVILLLCAETIILYFVYRGKILAAGTKHSLVFGVVLLAVLIWKRILGFYNLLYSSMSGIVYGASYTDIHARIAANWIFIAIIALVIVAWIAYLKKKNKKLLYSVALVPLVWLFVVTIYPALFQRFYVKPDELQKERPYISNYINFTRQAYGLDVFEEKEPEVKGGLSSKDLADNQATLKNVRFWDWRPLTQTYKQTELLRQYYEFPDIDIDRYKINGQYRQVMLATRELDQSKLPKNSQTWVNQRLKYTHGYGAVVNAVSEFTLNGMPNFLVKDIPPESSVPEIKITRPEIYFGELTKDHIFVNTLEPEFDYPTKDGNAYVIYNGQGGVPLGSGVRKLAFALKFNELNVLLSSQLHQQSRAMYYRQVNERLGKIAPFLVFDRDYYTVIDSQGKFWGMNDAYTVTGHYPYSEAYKGYNYIRNSVKAVIDPYNGKVTLFVFDDKDPLIQAYQKMFPRVFRPKEEMPKDLLEHVRYPEDILNIQARIYATFHMTDIEEFYQKGDLWQIAREQYGKGNSQEVIPYFVNIRLPGYNQEEFILTIPFTPSGPDRKNLIGWIAGRSDGANYGKVIAYRFTKQKLIYGPEQFGARASQQDEISTTFGRWSIVGSEIFRGNTLIIPIADTLLYVQPVFLRSKESAMPQIKKIIVAVGEKLEWGDTFEDALAKVIGVTSLPSIKTNINIDERVQAAIRSSQKRFAEYQRLTAEGKFAEAGTELKKLQEDLQELYGLVSR